METIRATITASNPAAIAQPADPFRKALSALRLVDWKHSSPLVGFHVATLALALFTTLSWKLLLLCVGSYYLRMLFLTSFYHRYFSHRSFQAGRVAQFVIGFLGATTSQSGPLWWAANHRHHHRFSDQPEDLHSPVQRGFIWAHVGWMLHAQHQEVKWDQIADLAKYPEMRWLDRCWLAAPVAYALALLAIGGFDAMVWGYFISTVLLFHGTFTINSLSHLFGSRRYATTDDSRNNPWLAAITLGEGWHNNHHSYPGSARLGFYWWEIDVSFYVLKIMSWTGFIRDLRMPPMFALESKRVGAAART